MRLKGRYLCYSGVRYCSDSKLFSTRTVSSHHFVVRSFHSLGSQQRHTLQLQKITMIQDLLRISLLFHLAFLGSSFSAISSGRRTATSHTKAFAGIQRQSTTRLNYQVVEGRNLLVSATNYQVHQTADSSISKHRYSLRRKHRIMQSMSCHWSLRPRTIPRTFV